MNKCDVIVNYVDAATSESGVVYWETLVSDLSKEKPKKLIDIFSSLSFQELERLAAAAGVALLNARDSELEVIKARLQSLNTHKKLTTDERLALFGPFILEMQNEQAVTLYPQKEPSTELKVNENHQQPDNTPVLPILPSREINTADSKKVKRRCETTAIQYPRGTLADPRAKTSSRVILSKSINASKDNKLGRVYLNYLLSTDESLDIKSAGDKVLTYFSEYRVQAFYAIKSDIKNCKIDKVLECPLSTSFKANHAYLIDKSAKSAKSGSNKKKIVSGLSALADLGVDTISEKEAELNRQLREDDFVDEELLAEIDSQSKYIK